jgi:hypothetical protein
MDLRNPVFFFGVVAFAGLAGGWLLSGRLKRWLTGRRVRPSEVDLPDDTGKPSS